MKQKTNKLIKTSKCTTSECVGYFLKKGDIADICLKCQEELKKFAEKNEREREREREN